MTAPLKIVVLGAGYGGLYSFRKLHKRFHADKSVELILVNKTNYFVSTPLLHEVATGGISPEHIVEPIRKVISCACEQFKLGSVEHLSLRDKLVYTDKGVIPYDFLVLALGSETNYHAVSGAQEHTYPLKTLEDAIRLKNHLIEVFDKAVSAKDETELAKLLHFVVVGGGGTGVELVAEISDFVYGTLSKYYNPQLDGFIKISLVHAGDELLQNFQRSIRTKSKNVMRKKNINVRLGLKVIEVRDGALVLNDGEIMNSDTIVWVAGVKPYELKTDVPLETDQGRVVVNRFLQVPSHPNIFALGDMAAFTNPETAEVLPMLAQVAHKESVGVARNVIRLVEGKNLIPYSYKHFGDLVSLGQWLAAGELFGFKFFGHLAWFFWRGVYLSKLLSFSKKIEVLIDWTIDFFTPRDISAIYQCPEKQEK